MEDRLLYFHILSVVALAVFALGLTGRVAFWLEGSIARGDRATRWRKAGYLLRAVWISLKGRRSLDTVPDVVLQRRIFRENALRWVMHFSLFFGFIELFFIGSLGNMIGGPLFGLSKDTPWFALLNELGGVLLLLGLAIAVYRRYLAKAPEMKNTWEDGLLLGCLGFLALSGYLVEALRLLAGGEEGASAAFLGYGLSRFMAPLDLDWHRTWSVLWWIHGAAGLALVAYIPYSKLMHVFAGPLSLVLANMDEGYPTFAAYADQDDKPGTRDFTMRELLELDACTRCGQCMAWCEVHDELAEESFVPMGKIRLLRSLLHGEGGWWSRISGRLHREKADPEKYAAGVYRCTLCARCKTVCPVGIDTRQLMLSMREDLVRKGLAPRVFNDTLQAATEQHNILDYPNEERALWLEFLDDVPDDLYQKDKAEVLYFVGCIGSFSPAAQGGPEAFLRILQAAGVDFAIGGDEEWCCGFPLIAAGMAGHAQALRDHNIERLRLLGARTVVFTCPSCYYTWRRWYAEEGIEFLHATEFIARLIVQGTLTLGEFKATVTYHDPCDLGRGQGVYDVPRTIIKSIPGVQLVELPQNRERGMCCGGGGDLEMTDRPLAESLARRLVEEAKRTGAEVLITACPECKRMTLNAVKESGLELKVMDIAELVLAAIPSPASSDAVA